MFELNGKSIEDFHIYQYFKKETDTKKFLLGIEAISWMENFKDQTKRKFLLDIKEIVSITNVPIELRYNEADFFIYPSGAKLLDEKLINDNLNWLSDYPKSYDLFKSSLLNLEVIGKERMVVDNLRLSMELILQAVFGNKKSLENQKSELGKYLKNKNISSEISNIYIKILDYYSKYQNNNVKHSDNINFVEIEFILYQTGTLMRLLIKK